MTEREKWRPRSHPSPLGAGSSRHEEPGDRRDAFSQRLKHVLGICARLGMFGMSALWLNQSILTDSDPMTGPEVVRYAAVMFAASTGALCVLGRPYLTLRENNVTVRNPLRIYRFSLSQVESVEDGFWGFPKLTAAGRRIRIMGMEQTGLAGLAGGSDDMVVFQAELADRDQAGMDTAAAGVSVRWSPMDRGLVLLLAVWAMYAASFFVP